MRSPLGRYRDVIFFASGFAGLIYESIWTHYLKLFLGHAAYAQSLVLAIFMGGMAIGAAGAARRTTGLARARRFGDVNRSVYEDPRSAIRIEDAKSFFAANGKTYDLIASEPSNPWVSGVSGLFSVEFYRHVSRHLNEDGLFAQWLQTCETHADRAISVLKAVDQAFDDYMVFALVEGDVLIVAKPHGKLALHEDAYARLSPQTRRQLRRLDIANLSDITFRLVGNKAMFKPLLDARPVPANSDFVPYLDSHADRDRFLQKGWPDRHNLATTRFPIAETLGGRPPLATPSALSITTHFGSDPAWLPARLLKETLLGPAAGRDAIPIPANLPEGLARQGNQVIELCNHPPRDDRPGAAAILGSMVLPFLSPAEGRDVLAALGRAACLDLLPGSQARWHSLLVYAAARKAKDLGAVADQLLASVVATIAAQAQEREGTVHRTDVE